MTEQDVIDVSNKLEGSFRDEMVNIRLRKTDSVHNYRDEPYVEVVGGSGLLKLTITREGGWGWHIEGDVHEGTSVDTTVDGDRELIDWFEDEVFV